MGGCRFRRGRRREHRILGKAVGAGDTGHGEAALRHRTGFIHYNRTDITQRFQRRAAFKEDPPTGTVADPREVGQRHTENEGAGTADYKEGQRRVDPLRPCPGDQRRDHRRGHGQQNDAGRIDAGKTGNEAVDLRFAGRRLFHRIEDPRDHRLTQNFFHTDLQYAGSIDAAGDHLITEAHRRRYRFPGHRRSVHAAFPLNDDTVQRNTVSGAHQQNIADHGVFGGDLRSLLAHEEMYRFGAHIHGFHDLAAAFRHRPFFKNLADAEEQHHRHGFGKITDDKRAQGRNGHQKIFIKDMAFQNILAGGKEDLLSQQ